MPTLPASETGLFAVRKGAEDWQEEIITTNPAAIAKARAWAGANGFDRFRLATVSLATAPNFAAAVRK